MAKFMKGDVVVIPFPFSDLSQSKRRPALVLATLEGDDAILCQITSKMFSDNYAVPVDNTDFRSGHLKQSGNIRPNRLFTADTHIILYRAGSIKKAKLDQVINKALSQKRQLIEKHADVIKDPYVLEFLGLEEKARYSEIDLETAIIDKLEHFLLELGKGFLFEARQKRFTFDEEHFFVDLVFYNRLYGFTKFIIVVPSIAIIDEPQSMDTTARSKQAIASLNPLCNLRYSATHVDKYHMLYKLDSVDAYEQKLVKQIEVAGVDVVDGHNKAYIKLISVDNKKSPITAKIEMDCRTKTGSIQRKTVTIKSRNDLLEKSSGRDIYDGYIIDEIYCKKGSEYIEFTSRPETLKPGQVVNEVDPDETKRLQIAKTLADESAYNLIMIS